MLVTELFPDTVITTNYDRLIEQAFDTGAKNARQVISRLNNDRIVQVFRAIKSELEQKHDDIIIPQHFAIEQAPESEQVTINHNAYLLGSC